MYPIPKGEEAKDFLTMSAQKNRARHLGLDPQPLELEEIHYCCLSHPLYNARKRAIAKWYGWIWTKNQGSARGNGEVSLEAARKVNKNNSIDLTVVWPKSSDFSGPSSSLMPTAARDHQAPWHMKGQTRHLQNSPSLLLHEFEVSVRGSKYIFATCKTYYVSF